jgi:hypothetical protein
MATSTLDSVLAQYEKAQQGSYPSNGNKMSQDERMKKYFAAILNDNEKQGSKRIRILPTPDGSSPFKEVWFHEMFIDGKWIKLYDPGMNDNERSPLNEVHEELTLDGDKELAKTYKSRKFYIVKVIDRDKEEDGPKFWRFKHNYKNEGILDKIIPIWRNKGDITEAEKGRDLILEMTKAKSNQGKGKEYTVIQTVMYDDPAPIHEDEQTKNLWVNDELTWSDVYSKKPVEYLEAIARGETPKWDNDQGKYVYGNHTSGEESFGGSAPKVEKEPKKVLVDPQANDEVDEELPF